MTGVGIPAGARRHTERPGGRVFAAGGEKGPGAVRGGGAGRKMKILHLLYESKDDYFGIGGVGVRAYEIYRYLRERHDVTLLCKKYPGARDGEIEGLRHVYAGTESRSLTKTFLSYACSSALFVRAHGSRFDIIIEEFSPAIPSFLHCVTRRPLVLQVQGYTGVLYFRKYNPAYAVTLSLLEQLRPSFYRNFIFINSETCRKFPLARPKRLEVIPNGVSTELLSSLERPADSRGYILFIGRIDIYGKGLDTLIDAYARFYKAFPETRLVVAGDGRDMELFRSMLAKLPEEVAGNVELTGWVSGDKKTDVLKNALFVVFPSRHEVQPIAVLEAMAAWKPVIVSDIREFSFVTGKNAGTSFLTGDAQSLAESMKHLMRSDEKPAMGRRGRDLVKDFTWESIALKFEDFLYAVLRERGEASHPSEDIGGPTN
jgi:glycosyltransferase involved in cell wall biosynthesis